MDAYYIGLMTGSSVDAIDAALVTFAGHQPALIFSKSTPYPETLRRDIISITHGKSTTVTDMCQLNAQVGYQLAAAAESLIQASGVSRDRILAIGSHGQTVCHLPNESPPATWQLGDPAQIVETTGIATVADFRSRDMAAGGQGAPFASAFHAEYLRSETEDRCVLNLGGIANITVLPADKSAPVVGFDTGPANALLDLWTEKHSGNRFDKDGEWASTGSVDEPLLKRWLSDPYFSLSAPKSTGRDYFDEAWLTKQLPEKVAAEDVQATLVELTVRTLAAAIKQDAPQTQKVFACGGGVKNTFLLERLRTYLAPVEVLSTKAVGIDPQWMESMLIAWLAAQAVNGLPGNLPSVTGASGPRVCGAIYPA